MFLRQQCGKPTTLALKVSSFKFGQLSKECEDEISLSIPPVGSGKVELCLELDVKEVES